jgi:hypothetical protein
MTATVRQSRTRNPYCQIKQNVPIPQISEFRIRKPPPRNRRTATVFSRKGPRERGAGRGERRSGQRRPAAIRLGHRRKNGSKRTDEHGRRRIGITTTRFSRKILFRSCRGIPRMTVRGIGEVRHTKGDDLCRRVATNRPAPSSRSESASRPLATRTLMER